jgi:nucleolar protein 56
MVFYYVNVCGLYFLDENLNIVKSKMFNDISVDDLIKFYNNDYSFLDFEQAVALPVDKVEAFNEIMLEKIRDDGKLRSIMKRNNTLLTKYLIRNAVNEDTLICQAISTYVELQREAYTMVKRLREWYSYYFPEISEMISDHERFVKVILEKSKDEICKEYNIEYTMGADLNEYDVKQLDRFAGKAKMLYEEINDIYDYLETVMKKYCPNVLALSGVTIGARLLELAGSLRRLSILPASTVQLLGAEKALFKHIRNKNKVRPPKHGVIVNHPVVQRARRKEKGKYARHLADKLSIAAKVDYFKGEFIADTLKAKINKDLKLELDW